MRASTLIHINDANVYTYRLVSSCAPLASQRRAITTPASLTTSLRATSSPANASTHPSALNHVSISTTIMRSRIPLPTTTTLLPLLLLLSSPHSILSTTTHPSTNLTSPLPPTPFCLTPSPSCTPPLYPDCTALLTTILSNPASRRLREFTTSAPQSQSDWHVPSTFYHATCRLTLSPLTILEWSSLAEIATAGLEAVEKCLGPNAVPAGKYAAGFNVAGLGAGLGVYLHGDVGSLAGGGVDVAKRQGGSGGQSCERVEEGRVVDLDGVGGWLGGAGGGQASTTKKRRREG